jgi:hypothetical protein
MRAICAVAVALLVSLGGSLAAGQQDASSQDTALAAWQQDASPQDAALAEALWRIAVTTHTRVGFQSIGRIRYTHFNKSTNPELTDVSHAVDAVVTEDPRYEWHLVGETAVIRPREAWTDGIPVSFQMKAGTVVDALNQLAEQAGQVMWVAWARPRDNPNGWDLCTNIGSCHADLAFELRDAERFNGGVYAQPQPGKPTLIRVPK